MGQFITGMSDNRHVRIYMVDTADVIESARAIHDLSPMSTAALGRVMTAAVLMGMMSKIDEASLTLQIQSSGDIAHMVAVADAHGHVKAYTTTPQAETHYDAQGHLDVGRAVGAEGRVIVVRDDGMKTPFVGQSQLVSGTIAEDITAYFSQSEQQATAVALGVVLGRDASIPHAGGFLVQLLPDASEETISQLESNLSAMASLTQLLSEGLDIRHIAGQVMAGLGLVELETQSVSYQCDCSRERMQKALLSLGGKALVELRDEDGGAEMTCHFCGARHWFSEDDLTVLIDMNRNAVEEVLQ